MYLLTNINHANSSSDTNITFFFLKTGDYHNVNYAGTDNDTAVNPNTGNLETGKQFYDQCVSNGNPNFTLPSGDTITNKPANPNVIVHFMDTLGAHYFYCGIGMNDDETESYHCKFGNVKAEVYVVNDYSECPFSRPPHCH